MLNALYLVATLATLAAAGLVGLLVWAHYTTRTTTAARAAYTAHVTRPMWCYPTQGGHVVFTAGVAGSAPQVAVVAAATVAGHAGAR